MKTILLYANQDSGLESRLQAALDVARSFGAHITCLQVKLFDAFIMGDSFGGVYALPTVLEPAWKRVSRLKASAGTGCFLTGLRPRSWRTAPGSRT